ncbi:MAG TPA: hypothetical protein VNM24_11305 [Burkholderiales bacterium]|nr:hypothetical protein [Burkholderiales bacterium]
MATAAVVARLQRTVLKTLTAAGSAVASLAQVWTILRPGIAAQIARLTPVFAQLRSVVARDIRSVSVPGQSRRIVPGPDEDIKP